MRLKACKEAGLKEVTIIKASDLTEEQQREFIIKDNVGFGEWDWEQLKEWDGEELEAWGLDLPKDKTLDTDGLFDIEIPFYTASDEKPNEIELADTSRSDELIKKIDSLDLDTRLKNILKIRAAFFTDFNFQKIADYYHNSESNIKELFEDLMKCTEISDKKLSGLLSSGEDEAEQAQEQEQTYLVTVVATGKQARIVGTSEQDVINKVRERHPSIQPDDITIEPVENEQ
jgi:hypothetical protein